MKIIFNKTLRNINETLRRRNIKVPDYMISRKLLKVISNPSEGISLLGKLSRYKDNISKENYYLILKIYEKNKDSGNKLIEKIGYFSFDDLGDIYNNIPDLLQLFIDNTNLLTKKNIELIGLDFLVNNMEYLKNIELQRIVPYLPQIKQYPENLPLFIKYIDNLVIFEFIINNLGNSNLNEIVFILENLKDSNLKEYIKNNLSDTNAFIFAKKIIYNGITIPKLSIVNCLDYIKEIKNVIPDADDKVIENFILFQIQDLKDKNEIMNCFGIMYKMLLNVKDVEMIKNTIDEAIKNNVELNNECQKVLKVYKLLDSKLPFKEILTNFETHYSSKDLSIDYNSIYSWIKKYKASLISRNLINLNDLSTVRNIEYRDQFDNIHQIPIKVIDDPNFEVLVHSISKKEENSLNKVANWQIGNQLVDNPNLWQNTSQTQGNPHISMSYFTGKFKPFGGKGLVLGFNNCDSDRLIATFSGDGATNMKTDMEKIFLENKSMYFEEHNKLKNCDDYNEILLHRYKNGNPLLPNYILLDSDSLTNMDTATKWAAYYNIPIVIIDKEKIGEKRKNDLETFLNTISIHRKITPQIKKELMKRLNDINWCYEHNRESIIDPFDILDYLMHNIKLTYENVSEMLDLLNKYHYASFNPHSNETIVQSRTLGLENFIPEKYRTTASIHEQEVIDIAKKRQQQVHEYLSLCKNYLNDENSNRKDNFNR